MKNNARPAIRAPGRLWRCLHSRKNSPSLPKLSDAESRTHPALSPASAFALALLDALEKKQIPRADVTPFTARQMADMKNDEVKSRVDKVWGQFADVREKKALIDKVQKMLTPDVLAKADLSAGRVVFNKTCAQCTLYGEGHKMGRT